MAFERHGEYGTQGGELKISYDYSDFPRHIRWLSLLFAASALSGCVASTFDSAASFAPDDSAPTGFALNANDSTPIPRPVEDVAATSTEGDFAREDDGDEVLAALESDAEPEGAPLQDVESSNAMAQPSGDEPQLAASSDPERTPESQVVDVASIETDLVTQRINAASGTTETQRFAPLPAPVTAQEKPPGGLLSLFSSKRADPVRANTNAARPPIGLAEARRSPVVTIAPAQSGTRPVIAVANASGSAALPGFDRDRTLGINAGSGTDDEEDFDGPAPIQLASAAGLARLAPNGLNIQHSGVDVACLKPALVRVLKQVESHYGRNVVVTSGYRSAGRNQRARGAKNSLHIYCSAADIQVEDVSKWELASYLRSIPGRGGVGTYCHTDSVHLDIGPQRDWNWRCRRRK